MESGVSCGLRSRGGRDGEKTVPRGKRVMLWEPHIQQRVGRALLIVGGSFIGDKAHVPVKPDGLGVLLVHRDLPYLIMPDPVSQQFSAKTLAAGGGGKKEHFQAVVFGAHKGDGGTLVVFGYDEVLHAAECPRDIVLDPADLAFRKEVVRCPNRAFLDPQKSGQQRCALRWFVQSHGNPSFSKWIIAEEAGKIHRKGGGLYSIGRPQFAGERKTHGKI